MKYRQFEYYLSVERMGRYYAACGFDKVRAKKLYRTNLKLSKAFLPLLSLFEVGLRNALNRELITHFADPDWIINQQSGFMVAASLGVKTANGRPVAERYLLNEVRKANDKLRRAAVAPSAARLVAEQSFGFWAAMFDKKYFHTLRRVPLRAFPECPAGTDEMTIFPMLKQVRDFRNRISHHEPICFDRSGIVSDTSAAEIRRLLLELAGWIGPDFRTYLAQVDSGFAGTQLRQLVLV